MKHVTIKDIARELNLSVSSISRAFNDKFDIKKETRELILKKAKEMGYTPNPIARKLSQKRSFNIGVVVPEFENSFFPKTIMGMQDVLLKEGYQVLIMPSNEEPENEIQNVKTLIDNMVDGIILSLCKETKNIDYYKELLDDGVPIVFFNRVNDGLDTSNVTFDDYKWAFIATEHLIRQGCKKPIFLAAPFDLPFAVNRKNGFLDAMKKHNIPDYEKLVFNAGIITEKGEECVDNLLSEDMQFDGVFAVNDLCAIGAMKAIKRNGLSIPGDVAVIGFTKTPLSKYVEPQLSTVEQPSFEMGKIAANLLLKQLQHPDEKLPPEKILLSGQLIQRASSMKGIKKGEK